MIIQVLILVVAGSRSIAFRPCFQSSGLVAAMVASSGIRRRLRTKTPPPPQPVQRELPEQAQGLSHDVSAYTAERQCGGIVIDCARHLVEGTVSRKDQGCLR